MKIKFLLFKIGVFTIFIVSMCPWFTLNISKIFFSISFLILSIPIIRDTKYVQKKSKYSLFIIPILFLGLWAARYNSFWGILDYIIHIYGFYVFWCLRDEFKNDILSYITRTFALILLPSIVVHLLYIGGISMPNTSIYMESEAYPLLYNYYFCIEIPSNIRFFSYFLEPGHMTMGLAPLLFVNRYDLKNKYVLILLLAQLLSFSLAGYIVTIIGYVFVLLENKFSLKKVGYLLLSILFIFSVLSWFNSFMREDVFTSLIWERMQWSNGKLAGDDRTTSEFEVIYEKFLDSSDILLGADWDESRFEKGLSSYKRYFISNGLIGLVLWFIGSLPLIRDKEYKCWGLFIVIFLLLYQNPYPFWWCIIIVTSMGTCYFKSEVKKNLLYV